VIVGASGVGSSSYDYAYLHKNIHDAMFHVVAGYKGMAEILLAMERREVDAVCGFDWASLKAQRPDLVRDGGFNYLLQIAVDPLPELTALGVPDATTFAANDEERAIVELVAAQQLFGRPYVVAPGVPVELVELLRKAFSETMRDPHFLADAEKARLTIVPASGAEVQAAIQRMYSAPRHILEGARNAIRP
jgi:hypothetical protein